MPEGETEALPTIRAAYGRLWRTWVARHRLLLALSVLLTLVFAGTTALLVQVTVWVVGAFDARDADTILMAPAVILAVTLVRALALFALRLANVRILATVEADMQRAMYRALLAADLALLQAEPPAALGARFTADIGVVRNVMDRVATALTYIATIAGAFGQMLAIDLALTLGVLAIFLVALVPVSAIGTRLKRVSRRTQAQIGAMTAEVNEGLAGARLAKAYRLEPHLEAAADRSFADLRRLKVKAMDWQARVEPIMEAFGGVALAALVAFVGLRIAAGTTSIADFSGFLAGLAIATQPMRKLGNLYALLTQGTAALGRIYALLDRENRVVDRPGARALPPARGALRFEGVAFRYADGTLALSGIDLAVEPGETVAVVGRSGAGKSSLFNLIPRLYDPSAGRILLDGHDLRDVTLASLRDQIALVSQDSVLLSDSVAANIGFGRPGATRAEIEAAARAAAAHDFISALPQGYDTRVGGAGGGFSGGERQRIAIARALLRDAPLLLLDEPTSALDAESEARIRAALRRLTEGRTTLVIAHRLATVQGADRIVVLDAGRIVEAGRHAELLARGGLYAELHRLQFREAG